MRAVTINFVETPISRFLNFPLQVQNDNLAQANHSLKSKLKDSGTEVEDLKQEKDGAQVGFTRDLGKDPSFQPKKCEHLKLKLLC